MADIEKMGIGWISSQISSTDRLKPHLKENDRTAFFDGNIFVYEGKAEESKFQGSIPVQVKSKSVKSFRKDWSSYSYSRKELEAFYREDGIILFLIEIILPPKKEYRSYIKILLPHEIKNILSEMASKKGHEKSIRHDFINLDEYQNFELKCSNFIRQRSLQASTKEYNLSPKDAKIFVLDIPPEVKNPYEYFLTNPEQIMYGKKDESTPPIYVDTILFENTSRKIERSVWVGNKKYYSEYYVEENIKREILINFGKSITWNPKKNILTFKLEGSFCDRLIDTSFFLDLIIYKEIYIDIEDKKINLTNIVDASNLNIEEIEIIERIHQNLLDTQAILDYFAIPSKDLIASDINPEKFKNFFLLKDLIVYNQKIKLNNIEKGIHFLQFGNLNFLVFIYEDIDKYIKIVNFYGENEKINIRYKQDENLIPCSRFLILHANDLIKSSNINFEVIKNNIPKYDFSDEYGKLINLFGLEILHAYDQTKNVKFLEVAESIFTHLISNSQDISIYKLNLFQCHRRKRPFSEEEIDILNKMKIELENNNELCCGIDILLENKGDFNYRLGKMTEKTRENFDGYPIMTLARKLLLVN